MSYLIWNSWINNVGIIGFRGAASSKNISCGNARADGYITLKDFIDNGWLKLRCENTIRQLEYIKRDFKPNGLNYIQDKKTIRKEQAESPDFADTLMMAVYAINYYSYYFLSPRGSRNLSSFKLESDYSLFDED